MNRMRHGTAELKKSRGIHDIVRLTHYCEHHEAIAGHAMQKLSELRWFKPSTVRNNHGVNR
ncbi:MAG: hypothetical protein C5B44_05130 [Acidobacteria bacterium]|nr:MAG: hypothetical protein C5B44_05130 [Acidobacteriota bacterium]